MYNPDNQYRCTIIRGKAQSDLDNLLPFYSNVVERLCPCDKRFFDFEFNNELSQLFLNEDFEDLSHNNQKTIRNHITEIAGKLFGLYYEEGGYVEITDSCKFLIDKGDHPAFFKNMCLNFQFPNATQKTNTIADRIKNNIKVKPFHFVVSLLDYACANTEVLLKQEIAYYVLNSMDVLQGGVGIKDVYDTIMNDRKNGITKPHLQGSRDMQHISEQLNLLELANIIRQDGRYIRLNTSEQTVIDIFKRELSEPYFDIYRYYEGGEFKRAMVSDWAKYYGSVRFDYETIKTTQEALSAIIPVDYTKQPQIEDKPTTVQVGDKGELYVFEMEKERVRNYKERHTNKVLLLGKIRGIGYDISSIEAEGDEPEFARYIEVKSTIRVTEPVINDTWRDSVSLTAKEWTAAKQYKEFYNVYRVYFTPNKTIVYRINDPYTMNTNNELDVYPTMYQMDIRKSNIIDAF